MACQWTHPAAARQDRKPYALTTDYWLYSLLLLPLRPKGAPSLGIARIDLKKAGGAFARGGVSDR